MEDIQKRFNHKLVTDKDKYVKLAHSHFFHDSDIITDHIVGVHTRKPKVILDKPVFVSKAVLLNWKCIIFFTKFYLNVRLSNSCIS